MVTGLILGYAAFAVSLGYQILYYGLGEKIHFWCPLGIDNYQILTAIVPWFSALSLGVFASGAEELLYRVIMLGFAQKFLKHFWLANLLQAMAWGFMHSGYPQQPAYARGVELTIEGMFWGWIMRRYGLLPCLVSHYLFDVFCDVIPLLSAPIFRLKLSALVPLVPFLILAIIGIIQRRKKGQAEEDNYVPEVISPPSSKENLVGDGAIGNASHQASDQASAKLGAALLGSSQSAASYVYAPLTKSARIILGLSIAIMLAVCWFWQEPHYAIYQNGAPLKIDRQAAIKIARDQLIKNHFDLNGYTPCANCSDAFLFHKDEFQYMFEKIGFDKTDAIVHRVEHPHLWAVRYFKPECPEEYAVTLDENGQVVSQGITRDEDAAGAKLTEKQARKIAEDFLRQYRPLYEPLVFSDVEVKNRKNRTDYDFQFKSPKYKVADADLIISIAVVGDVPADVSHRWKVPDDWKWAKSKITFPKAIAMIALAIISLAVFALFIWWLISLFLARLIHWRPVLLPALIFLASMALLLLNLIPTSFYFYRTTIPVPSYITMVALGGLIGLLFAGAFIVFFLGLSTGAINQFGWTKQVSFTARSLIPWLAQPDTKTRYNFWLDAFLMAGTYQLFSFLFSVSALTLGQGLSHNVLIVPLIAAHEAANAFSPTLSALAGTIPSVLSALIFVIILISMLAKFGIKKDWQIFGLILAVSIIGAAATLLINTEFYWQEMLFHLISGLTSTLLLWYFLRTAVKRNALSFLVLLFIGQAVYYLHELIKCGWTLWPADIISLVIINCLPLFYLLYLAVQSRQQK